MAAHPALIGSQCAPAFKMIVVCLALSLAHLDAHLDGAKTLAGRPVRIGIVRDELHYSHSTNRASTERRLFNDHGEEPLTHVPGQRLSATKPTSRIGKTIGLLATHQT